MTYIMKGANDSNGSGKSRRDILKMTSAATAAGALGTLAGCAGGNNGGGEKTGAGDGDTDTKMNDGGNKETVTIQYLSATAAENPTVGEIFSKSMTHFEEKTGNVKVDLNAASYGDIKAKLPATISAGNAPTIAEAGSLALNFFLKGDVPSHGQWIKETEGLPEEWTKSNQAAANFRGDWWCGGACSGQARGIFLRPKLVSKVGVTDPLSEMSTWSGLLDVIKRIDTELEDVIAWEETGASGDLESYWAQARTSFTDGADPWIHGDPTNPEVLMGKDPRTNGMVKNCVTLANTYSSDKAASRTDEEMAALMLTDRVAIDAHGLSTWKPFTLVKEDATFGWNGGSGDVMWIPDPKLDPDYGANIGISELSGHEGEHGGHMPAIEAANAIFDVGDQKKMDLAWDLNVYMQQSEYHMFNVYGKAAPAIPLWRPMLERFKQELETPQVFTQALEALQEYGAQYTATGASWDVAGTDEIRWQDINKTVSQAIAGQINLETLPDEIRKRMSTTLQKQSV